MYSQPLRVIIIVILFVSMIITTDNGITKDNTPPLNPLPQGEGKLRDIAVLPPPLTGGREGESGWHEKKIEAKKGIVAFIELSSTVPADIYLMYPTQYNKYKASGSLEGVIEFKEISWLFYPVPALLEDQTVYIVSKENVNFNITYENIQERIDRLFAGEEQLRAGTEMSINNGITVVRLTQLIPGLKVRLDLTENAQFVITRTIDLARYNKGLKGFDQLYKENALKGSSDHFNFITSDFEDLYLLVRTDNQIRLKYMIWATKESAESGC